MKQEQKMAKFEFWVSDVNPQRDMTDQRAANIWDMVLSYMSYHQLVIRGDYFLVDSPVPAKGAGRDFPTLEMTEQQAYDLERSYATQKSFHEVHPNEPWPPKIGEPVYDMDGTFLHTEVDTEPMYDMDGSYYHSKPSVEDLAHEHDEEADPFATLDAIRKEEALFYSDQNSEYFNHKDVERDHDLELDVASNPENAIANPTAQSEYEFFSTYVNEKVRKEFEDNECAE